MRPTTCTPGMNTAASRCRQPCWMRHWNNVSPAWITASCPLASMRCSASRRVCPCPTQPPCGPASRRPPAGMLPMAPGCGAAAMRNTCPPDSKAASRSISRYAQAAMMPADRPAISSLRSKPGYTVATMSKPNRPVFPVLDFSATPPVAPRKPKRLIAHGHTREDPYHWLNRRRDPAVLAHLQAENAYAETAMAPLAGLRETLYAEMLARIQEDDQSVPLRLGAWMYYSRTEQGLAYPIHARKRVIDERWEHSPEEVVLDENREAEGKTFYEVGDFEVSPDGNLLAWAEDTRGNRQYRLRLRDLRRRKDLRLSRQRITSLVWATDNRTLFYTVEDAVTQRSFQLWRHRLGEREDALLFTEHDERFSLSLMRTRSDGFLVLTSGSHTTNELRLLPADRPDARWRLFARRRAGIEYELDHHEERLLLRVNDSGPNFRLLEVPVGDWRREAWRELMAHDEAVVIEGVDLWRDWQVLSLRIYGQQTLRVTALATGETHDIAFEELAYSIEIEDLPAWDSPFLRYEFESLTTPDATFDYDPLTRRATCVKQTRVLGGFDAAHYVSRRLEALAADGTRIPVSIVHHRDTPLDGNAPLWLEGYGAYGIATDPWFSSTRLSLLDRGWIYAIAHVRGGGELGQRWHDGGRLKHKPNSFSDFVACGKALASAGYTRAGRILANGGSAGGLLVAASLRLDPALFGAAVLEVPFVDVVTTMLDPSLPLTVGEYEEWGNPQRVTDYRRLLAWSPYDTLDAHPYPPVLVEAGLHDSQVMVWEPAKYVARLRERKGSPALLVTNLEAGHGGASGRYASLHERARHLAFALAALGS
ncbi:MAG: oligopeptidase B [Candidatus Dactylopiibacterium carminicum]|nr:MAG: oligopeptidase B [Candidatus Dactylopiibacterium carminicum]